MGGTRGPVTGSLRRPALALVLCAGLLSPVPEQSGDASEVAAICTSEQDPDLAREMGDRLAALLVPYLGSVSLRVTAPGRALECGFTDGEGYEAASVVKVLVLLTAVHRAEEEGREPSGREARLLQLMITESDNDATTELWDSLGEARLEEVLEKAGTEDTELISGGSWGLTEISARDLDRLLALLTEGEAIEDPTFALDLLGGVRNDQNWGVSAGAPSGVSTHLKNGWLPRGVQDWRVHSAGLFLGGPDGPYRVTVLTRGSATLPAGIAVIEQLAGVVHGYVAPEW